jgi:hypothetical protein
VRIESFILGVNDAGMRRDLEHGDLVDRFIQTSLCNRRATARTRMKCLLFQ